MNWFDILLSVSLVAIGGAISVAGMLLLQWFNNRKKCKDVAKLIVEDIRGQGIRMLTLAGRPCSVPNDSVSEALDFLIKEFLEHPKKLLQNMCNSIINYDSTVFKTLIRELPVLPSDCFEKVLGYYQMLAAFSERLRSALEERDQKRFVKFFCGGLKEISISALETEASIEEKVFSNAKTAEVIRKTIQIARNEDLISELLASDDLLVRELFEACRALMGFPENESGEGEKTPKKK